MLIAYSACCLFVNDFDRATVDIGKILDADTAKQLANFLLSGGRALAGTSQL
jgi:hypothetical protein